MSLPLVVSTVNLHSLQIRNMRAWCRQEAYLKKHGLNKNLQHNLTFSKACLHKRKSSRSTRKKAMKRSSPLITVDENDSNSKGSEKSKVLCNRDNKRAHRVNKLQAANNLKDLNNSSIGIVCSVRKLIASYSNKNISSTAQILCKNPKVSPRPKTISGGETTQSAGIKIKRESCPPPLFQQSTSPASRNAKLKKVYHSEPHSQMMSGVPCVPPVSPLNDFVTAEIVPCLADIKSQQLIKSKLRCLVTQRQKQDEKLREKIQKEVKRKEREQNENLRQQRRAEVYALNKVMTEHERNKFLQFMQEKNNGPISISLRV